MKSIKNDSRAESAPPTASKSRLRRLEIQLENPDLTDAGRETLERVINAIKEKQALENVVAALGEKRTFERMNYKEKSQAINKILGLPDNNDKT